MDIKEFTKEIHARFDRVSSRLAALNKEREQLEAEHESLLKLAMLYDNMAYDSITEERRVTEQILQPAVRVSSPKKNKSQYDEPLEVIFTTASKPLALSEIHESLCELTEKEIQYKNMVAILNQQMRKGAVKRVGYGKYAWISKEE